MFKTKKAPAYLFMIGLLFLSMLLSVLQGRALAAGQLSSRSLTISTSNPSATGVTHTFNFAVATTGNIGSMEFLYCTTALGTCTAPTGLSVSSATIGTQTINGSATSFTIGTNTANKIQITRTAASATAGWAVVMNFSGITNPSTSTQTPAGNNSFFVRITTYATNTYTTTQDTGTVASAITAQFQVSATIQETLNFCVGTTAVDDATSSLSASDCSGISGTSLNLGTVDTTTVCVSGPSNTCTGNDGVNAVAMLRTNSSGGTTVGYKAVQASGTNHKVTLRVSGATCSASNVPTDQCIDAKGTTQGTLTAGTEGFGVTVGGVNCAASSTYSCTFSTGVYNLIRDTQYDGTGANTFGTSGGYAWDESGSLDTIASTSGSTKVVDDEALILKFAAAASSTTPAGTYSVGVDFIATPTY